MLESNAYFGGVFDVSYFRLTALSFASLGLGMKSGTEKAGKATILLVIVVGRFY